MKKILIQHQFQTWSWDERLFADDLSSFATNNLHDQNVIFLRCLREKLLARGYLLVNAASHDLADCALVIFVEAFSIGPASFPMSWVWPRIRQQAKKLRHPELRRELYRECMMAGMRDRVVLLILEPPAVQPYNWDARLFALFPKVFTYDTKRIDYRKYFRWLNPRPVANIQESELKFNERKLLVCIQGNKYSSYVRELYSARRNTIRYFERHHSDLFDLFGVYWNRPVGIWQRLFPPAQPFYPSYRGVLRNKDEIYSQYRFGLIYENCVHPGWVSEKLFDCMEAGCVPVYWGAPDITNFVPPEAFVDRTGFGSDAELARYLLDMPEEIHVQYRVAIKNYLASQQYQMFSIEACANYFLEALALPGTA